MEKDSEAEKLKENSFRRSDCSLACTLDLIGDKWTLLIIRDLFFGKSRYGELINSSENIPSNILAARLKHLEQTGLISKSAYQERPVRYEYHLTNAGKSLGPVLKEIVHWADKNLPGTRNPF